VSLLRHYEMGAISAERRIGVVFRARRRVAALRMEAPVKPFTALSVLVFSLVALLQLVRAIAGWEVSIDGMPVPIWASVVAFVVATLLAIMLWREAHRSS